MDPLTLPMMLLTRSTIATSSLAWGIATGFCLTLAGTLAAAVLGVPRRAWGRRMVVGAAAGMLLWGLATALTAAWGARPLAGPTWLGLAAPFLGALGGLVGSLVEGVSTCAGGHAEGRKMRRG